MLTPAEKREFAKLQVAVAEVRDRLDLYPVLAEMNATLKEMLAQLNGMTPEEINQVVARLNATSDKLDAMSK